MSTVFSGVHRYDIEDWTIPKEARIAITVEQLFLGLIPMSTLKVIGFTGVVMALNWIAIVPTLLKTLY